LADINRFAFSKGFAELFCIHATCIANSHPSTLPNSRKMDSYTLPHKPYCRSKAIITIAIMLIGDFSECSKLVAC